MNKPEGTTRTRKKGFTLVEMLAVFTILIILLGLGIVAIQRIMVQTSISHTKEVLSVVVSAIDAYEEDTGSYPSPNGSWAYTSALLSALRGNNEARSILIQIDEGQFQSSSNGTIIADGFDRATIYKATGRVGGGPCVVSAGNDGKFGQGYGMNDGGVQYAADNIRSDQLD